MVDMTATIATSFPAAPLLPVLYAHHGPMNVRKFLYQEREPAAFTVQLSESMEPNLRFVLSDAVRRLNEIYTGFSARGCDANDLLPDNLAAMNALKVISILDPPIPAQIFPLAGGGVQIEWHHGDLDVEIESLADGSVYIYLAVNKKEFIDEHSMDGHHIVELLKQVGKELGNAIVDFGVGSHVFYG